MSGLINIPSFIEDPNYRYRMPRAVTKIEGRGNGIKTNITNCGDISKALKRNPEYLTRFCGCELGAAAKFEAAEGKAIVNGSHPQSDVQTVIDKFIERFVLCPKCSLPEVDLFVESKTVMGLCNACGMRGKMENVHKVATYIIKNPPAESSTVKDKSKRSEKEAKDKKKQAKKAKKANPDDDIEKNVALSFDSEELIDVIRRLANLLKEKVDADTFVTELRVLQLSQDFDAVLRVYSVLLAIQQVLSGDDATEKVKLNASNLESFDKYLSRACDRSVNTLTVLKALEELYLNDQIEDIKMIVHAFYLRDYLTDEAVIIERYDVEGVSNHKTSNAKKGQAALNKIEEEFQKRKDAAEAKGPEELAKLISKLDKKREKHNDEAVTRDRMYEARERISAEVPLLLVWLKNTMEEESSSEDEDSDEEPEHKIIASSVNGIASALQSSDEEESDIDVDDI